MLYVTIMEDDGYILRGVWRTREAAAAAAAAAAFAMDSADESEDVTVVGELQEAGEMLATFDGTQVWVGQLSGGERFFVYEMSEED